ncbi:MAG: hypothetical protein R2705_15340 [Ilumatobacteraceae bacterium]
MAIGAGADVAIESARVVLASSDPRAITSVIDLSRASARKMRQNLVWATAPGAVAIPVAAGAFAFAGITMPPAIAAITDEPLDDHRRLGAPSSSSVVSIYALRARRGEPGGRRRGRVGTNTGVCSTSLHEWTPRIMIGHQGA